MNMLEFKSIVDAWWEKNETRLLEIIDNPQNPFRYEDIRSFVTSQAFGNYMHSSSKEMTFSDCLRKFVSKSPLTNEQIAEKARVSVSDLSAYLYKNRNLTQYKKDAIFRIGLILRLSLNDISYLLSLTNTPINRNNESDRTYIFFFEHEIYEPDEIDAITRENGRGNIFADRF